MNIYLAVDRDCEGGYNISWGTTDVGLAAQYLNKNRSDELLMCNESQCPREITFDNLVNYYYKETSLNYENLKYFDGHWIKECYLDIYNCLEADILLEVEKRDNDEKNRKEKQREKEYSKYLELKDKFENNA